MKKSLFYIASILVAAAMPSVVMGGILGDNYGLSLRAGYSIGGTSPMGLPPTISSIDAFRLTPSFCVGADASYSTGSGWGIAAGLHLENKAMNTDVTVRSYHMEMNQGSTHISGVFTGHVHQEVTEWMLTLPLQATYSVGDKLTLRAGPYVSLLVKKEFKGVASDGYLREGDPTGPRITIGDTPETEAPYEFSDDMNRWQFGVGIGLDWQVFGPLGVTADLNWGLTPVFPKDFKTVEQPLYPVYGTLGARYTF